MKKLTINLKDQSYNILIEKNLINSFGILTKKIFNGKKIAIITDTNLSALYGEKIKSIFSDEGYDVSLIVITAGEKNKSFDCLLPIYEKLLNLQITRSDLIVAFGGGVVGDFAGFIASTFLRGISFVQIPTSLLAQVDSSVGGKVAVDIPSGKNLIGSFYHPKLVLIDTNLLKSLPEKYFNDGMGEVIKYAFIKDLNLYNELNNFSNKNELKDNIDNIIYNCCNIKREVVEIDEKDTGQRMILNFGHTIGHAIEKFYNFEKFSHGEAVSIGMYVITLISEKNNLTLSGTAEKIKDLLIKFDLPYKLPFDNFDSLIDTMKIDKKNIDGYLNLILLKDVGNSYIFKANVDFFK